MTLLFIFAGVVVLGLMVIGIYAAITGQVGSGSAAEQEEKTKYQYSKKPYFLTRAEQEFYNALGQAMSHEYRIFAQVHLGSILDERIKGQNWKAARAHINRKSVDFLLCDKDNLTPILAIELDDKSHEREDRKTRDTEVERILAAASLPLLRIPNRPNITPAEVTTLIHQALNSATRTP